MTLVQLIMVKPIEGAAEAEGIQPVLAKALYCHIVRKADVAAGESLRLCRRKRNI
jgi:hypothetical protein